jgi:hypothetical protein
MTLIYVTFHYEQPVCSIIDAVVNIYSSPLVNRSFKLDGAADGKGVDQVSYSGGHTHHLVEGRCQGGRGICSGTRFSCLQIRTAVYRLEFCFRYNYPIRKKNHIILLSLERGMYRSTTLYLYDSQASQLKNKNYGLGSKGFWTILWPCLTYISLFKLHACNIRYLLSCVWPNSSQLLYITI